MNKKCTEECSRYNWGPYCGCYVTGPFKDPKQIPYIDKTVSIDNCKKRGDATPAYEDGWGEDPDNPKRSSSNNWYKKAQQEWIPGACCVKGECKDGHWYKNDCDGVGGVWMGEGTTCSGPNAANCTRSRW